MFNDQNFRNEQETDAQNTFRKYFRYTTANSVVCSVTNGDDQAELIKASFVLNAMLLDEFYSQDTNEYVMVFALD